eukprot:GHVO01015676.1.p1 GENE.GHVO01015676.1~~GHVO01015676.1.p1  ORF type:complete len:140 (+),score=1.59 GHVO01015676.1:276-695(+)
MMIKSRRQTTSDHLEIKIDDVVLDQVNCAKYLGIDIDVNLTWNDYVSVLTRKVVFKLSLLRRTIHAMPQYIAEKIYLSTVQPCIDYAISVWGQTTETNLYKIQRLQNYGARIALNDFNYEHRGMELVKHLKWMNVKDRC